MDVPENDMLLDEDKLLPEQPEKVREASSKYYRSRPDDYIAVDGDSLPEQNGGLFLKEVIRQLAREGEPEPKKAASLLLNSLGIKGITYDGSRDGRCFVVFDDKAVSVIERYNQEVTGQPLVREGLTRKPDSAQAKVVHLPEKAVPQFPKIQDFNKWVKALLMNDGNPPVKILSTGQEATFTGTNIKASLKRARSEAHREAYAALRQMISLAEYDRFEPADVKHPYVQGQDVYYSALSVGDRLYSVRLKLDVPPSGDKGGGSAVYKDHKLTEIEIAPALYSRTLEGVQGSTQEADAIKIAPALYGMEFDRSQSHTQEAGAISTVSLGVLRGNVKPSSYDGAHLSQKRRGQIQIGPNGEGLITLFKHADRSTFFHEMGHMMLDDLIADGLLEKANARTKADLDAVRAYLGIGDMDLSKRHTFDGAEKARYAEAQERFARSFEAYLMEGKSPTEKMRGVFARVRQWLIDIYHDLSRLNVELSPEVREVFDRLLATPDEIGQIPRVVQAQREAEFVRPAREVQERGNFGPVWRGYRGEAAIESNRDFSVRSDLNNFDVRSAWDESSWDLVRPHAETRSGVESSGGYNTVSDGKDYYVDGRNGRRREITPDRYTERYTKSRVKRIGEAMRVLENASETPIRRGASAPKGVLGYFDGKKNAIHIKAYNDIRAATHEIGHAYDQHMRLRDGIADMVGGSVGDGETRRRGQAIYGELCELGKGTSPAGVVQAFERNDGTGEWVKARDYLMKEGIAEAFALTP